MHLVQCVLSQEIDFLYFQNQKGRYFQNGHIFKTN